MKKKKFMSNGDIVANIIVVAATLIFAAVFWWFALPAINIQSAGFWFYIIVVIGFAAFAKIISDLTALKMKVSNSTAIISLVAVALAVIAGIISFAGSPLFRASSYKELIVKTDGDFAADVSEISLKQIPVVDRDTADRLGQRKMGEMTELVSQFEIEDDYTQINYKGQPVRVSSLRYSGFFKWLNNHKEGIPAYIMVDMVTQDTQLIKLDGAIKYAPSEYFMRDLRRHIRFSYPTAMLEEFVFEIDEDGHPYWIVPAIEHKIGLFNASDVEYVLIVDAVSGEIVKHNVEDVPKWVDRVYNADMIIEQLNWNGIYQNGFFNSIIGQKNTTMTTEGYNYVAINDDVYLYTGITSVVSDESNLGFVLVNMRTKETKYYSCPGAEEYSAMDSAQGQVQHLGYTATFPILLNIDNRPTYFMSLKDNAGLVKMYAFVDAERYQIVATGQTIESAKEAYEKLSDNDDELNNQQSGEQFTASGIIGRISSAVIEGNSVYYFTITSSNDIYRADISVLPSLAIAQSGDSVSFKYVVKADGTNSVTEISFVSKESPLS